MKRSLQPTSLFDRHILGTAALDAFAKFDPRTLWRSPIIFTTALIALFATVLFVRDVTGSYRFQTMEELLLWSNAKLLEGFAPESGFQITEATGPV